MPPERKQDRADENENITQDNMIMNDRETGGDVDGDDSWSHVIYPQFVFFPTGDLLQAHFVRPSESRGMGFSHRKTCTHRETFTQRSPYTPKPLHANGSTTP